MAIGGAEIDPVMPCFRVSGLEQLQLQLPTVSCSPAVCFAKRPCSKHYEQQTHKQRYTWIFRSQPPCRAVTHTVTVHQELCTPTIVPSFAPALPAAMRNRIWTEAPGKFAQILNATYRRLNVRFGEHAPPEVQERGDSHVQATLCVGFIVSFVDVIHYRRALRTETSTPTLSHLPINKLLLLLLLPPRPNTEKRRTKARYKCLSSPLFNIMFANSL